MLQKVPEPEHAYFVDDAKLCVQVWLINLSRLKVTHTGRQDTHPFHNTVCRRLNDALQAIAMAHMCGTYTSSNLLHEGEQSIIPLPHAICTKTQGTFMFVMTQLQTLK